MSWTELARWIAIGAVAVAGLIGTVAALGNRTPDSQLLAHELHPPGLATAEVERLMLREAPDPNPPNRANGARANCHAPTTAGLRNPWLCHMTYPGGSRADYRLTFGLDGSYSGRHVGGTGRIRGCCAALAGQ